MRRVLHIARYRHAMLDRKMTRIAATGEFEISLIRPGPPRPLPPPSSPNANIPPIVWMPLIGTNPHTAVYRALAFALPRLRPDLIHAEEEPDSVGALQIAVARRLFAPRARLLLHTWQNVNRQKGWHVWRVIRTVLSQADGVLCSSAEAIELLRTLGFYGPTDEVPQYGVDLTTFRPDPERRPSPGLSIIYVGRMIVEKGIDTLIDAVALLDASVQLTIIGDGPLRGPLEARGRAVHAADRIHFVPRVPPEDLARRMAQADVLVLPSRTTAVWKEQFGRVLVEAMACELPLIGSSSGAIPGVIGDAGLVFAEGDVRELAQCLRRLMVSVALRRELGARGRARVLERFSQEVIAARTAEFYRRMLDATESSATA